MVVVVTRQPYSRAAWIEKAPQPVPISSKWSSGVSSSLRHRRSIFATDASRNVDSGVSKMPQEYVIVSSSHRPKKSFERS